MTKEELQERAEIAEGAFKQLLRNYQDARKEAKEYRKKAEEAKEKLDNILKTTSPN